MTGVAEFIRARLDEDEQTARANIGDRGLGDRGLDDASDTARPSWPDYQTYTSPDVTAAETYLDRFRPARSLRQVEIIRAIVDAWQEDEAALNRGYTELGRGAQLAARGVCHRLAGIWRDHPDYEEGWR